MKAGVPAALAALLLSGCVSAPPGGGQSAPLPVLPAEIASTSATTAPVENLMAVARESVFRIRNAPCLETGSSFLTAEGLVTNRHVAAGGSGLELSTWDGVDSTIGVTAVSTGPDLALLGSASFATTESLAGFAPLSLSAADPAVGTEVWAAGYPLGNQLTLTPGQVIGYASVAGLPDAGRVIRLTNPVQHGDSGGALLNKDGLLVGVVFALDPVTGNGLAIPVSGLRTYLAQPTGAVVTTCIS